MRYTTRVTFLLLLAAIPVGLIQFLVGEKWATAIAFGILVGTMYFLAGLLDSKEQQSRSLKTKR